MNCIKLNFDLTLNGVKKNPLNMSFHNLLFYNNIIGFELSFNDKPHKISSEKIKNGLM